MYSEVLVEMYSKVHTQVDVDVDGCTLICGVWGRDASSMGEGGGWEMMTMG